MLAYHVACIRSWIDEFLMSQKEKWGGGWKKRRGGEEKGGRKGRNKEERRTQQMEFRFTSQNRNVYQFGTLTRRNNLPPTSLDQYLSLQARRPLITCKDVYSIGNRDRHQLPAVRHESPKHHEPRFFSSPLILCSQGSALRFSSPIFLRD